MIVSYDVYEVFKINQEEINFIQLVGCQQLILFDVCVSIVIVEFCCDKVFQSNECYQMIFEMSIMFVKGYNFK